MKIMITSFKKLKKTNQEVTQEKEMAEKLFQEERRKNETLLKETEVYLK